MELDLHFISDPVHSWTHYAGQSFQIIPSSHHHQ